MLRLLRLIVALAIASGCEPGHTSGRAEAPTNDAIIHDSSRLAYVRTIGGRDSFGSVDAALFFGEDVAVIDRMNGRLRLYDPAGHLRSSLGRKGVGPGEFLSPAGLGIRDSEILVLDRGNNRISSVGWEADSLYLAYDIRLPFLLMAMCVLGNRIFLLGLWEGRIVHEIDDEGNIEQSFGTPSEQDPLSGALSSAGQLACSHEDRAIAVGASSISAFWVFSPEGRVIWHGEIPGFSQTVYEVTQGSVRPRAPEGGTWHRTVSLNWLGDSRLLIQLDRRSRDRESGLESRIFDLRSGWLDRAPAWSRRVTAFRDGQVLVVEENPYPLVKLFDVR